MGGILNRISQPGTALPRHASPPVRMIIEFRSPPMRHTEALARRDELRAWIAAHGYLNHVSRSATVLDPLLCGVGAPDPHGCYGGVVWRVVMLVACCTQGDVDFLFSLELPPNLSARRMDNLLRCAPGSDGGVAPPVAGVEKLSA